MHIWLQLGELFARVSMGAILNSLWQGLLLTLVAWLCLRLVPRSSASLRYGIWCIALVAVLALPVIAVQAVSSGLAAHASTNVEPVVAMPQRFAQFLFAVWYVAASALVIRLIWSYIRLQQLKASAVPLPPLYQHQVRRWLAACGGRRACRLCVSDQVPMPVAIGLVDPVIILPERLIEQLSNDEFDQIGMHEVAHLQRWDDYTNVFQKIVEALLFFNPAVYLIGRQLTLEREIACDDRVIAATGKPLTYALCLTRLVEATALARQPMHALGALSTRRQFAIRIERLLDRRGSVPAASRFAAATACLGIAASLVVAARLGSLIGIAPDDLNQGKLAAAPASTIAQPAHTVVTPRREVALATVTASAHPAPVAGIVEVRRITTVARPNAVGARNFTDTVVDVVAVDIGGHTLHKLGHNVFIVEAPTAHASEQSVDAATDAQFEALNSMAAAHAELAHQVAQIAQLDVRISRETRRLKRVKFYVVTPRVADIAQNDLGDSSTLAASASAVNSANAAINAANAAVLQADALPQGVDAPPVSVVAPPPVPAPAAIGEVRTLTAQTLAAALESADSLDVKIRLIDKLVAYGELKPARDALIAALDDDSIVVKMYAIRALTRHLERSVERTALIRALRNCDSVDVQLHIIAAFARDIGDPDVRKALTETLLRDDASSIVQAAAAQALAPLANDPEVHAALVQAGGQSETVRAIVTHALGQHPNN